MKTFTVLGEEISFSPASESYRDIFVKYHSLALEAKYEFEESYRRAVQNVDHAIREITLGFQTCLQNMTEVAVSDLASRGIYEVDEKAFLEAYQKHTESNDLLSPISDVLDAVVPASRDHMSNSGTWIGGGFGLEGAAQGIAIATAANLIGGAVSAANAGVRRAKDRQEIRELLASSDSRRRLLDAIQAVALAAHNIVFEHLSARGGISLDRPSREDCQRSQAIIRNVAKGRVSPDAERGAMGAALKLNPYDPIAYLVYHTKFGEDPGLDELADYLEIDPAEAAATAEGVDLLGVDQSRAVAHFGDALIDILSGYIFKDLHVSPNIPAKKAHGAASAYFNENVFAATNAGLADLAGNASDPGELLAVIDNTLFGSATKGVAFGTNGVAWKCDVDAPMMISWRTFQRHSPSFRKTLFGVAIADKDIAISGADVTRSALFEIFESISRMLPDISD